MTTAAAAASAERALVRMRRYTTLSFVGIVVAFALLGALQLASLELDGRASVVSLVALVVAGAAATVIVLSWEEAPAAWLELALLGVCVAAWTAIILVRGTPGLALIIGIAFAVVVARTRDGRIRRAVLGAFAILVPVGVGWLVHPAANWAPWVTVGVVAYLLAIGVSLLTVYTWSLYLEIDAARRGAAALAVAQERYRFASDLHDIQGHTLHVIRLKTQLARRLLDADPTSAREHLLEAESLIEETLANTRSLAFGDREVALAAELANAVELFAAGGIRCTVTGEAAGVRDEELFGLTVRETTTNILRHSQARSVTIGLAPNRLEIVNDGAPAAQRPPSGLARLGERFEARGGSLRTWAADGTFTTEAVLP